MIISLILVAASYYSAPVGMIILGVGMFYEWRKSGIKENSFVNLAKKSVFMIPGIVLLLSAVIGPIIYGNYINAALAFLILFPIVFCLIGMEVLWKKEDALHFARYATMLIIPIAVISFLFPWAGGPFVRYSENFRIAATFSNPNYFSYFLEITIIYSIALFYHIWQSSSRFWLSVSLFLSVVCLYLTGSRTGMMAFLVGITIFCFFMSEKVVLSIVFGTLSLILIATSIFPERSVLIFRDIIPRPETFLTEIKYRFMLWDVALNQIMRNPFVGTGIDTYRLFIPKDAPHYLISSMHSHNIFINFWLETGFFGVASFVWVILRTGARAIKALKETAVRPYLAAGAAIIAVTVIHGIMDAPLVSSQNISLFCAFLGCITVMSRQETTQRAHE